MLKIFETIFSRIFVGVITVVFFVAGCASVYKGPVVRREVPQIEEGKYLKKQEIIAYLESQPELRNFRAKGKISIRTNKWSGSGKVFVAGEYPTKLHFEVFDFFGNPKWIINATQHGVEALNVASRELYVSRNTRDLMNGLFAIPADLDEIFFFFTGQNPPLDWSKAKLTPIRERKCLILETRDESTDDWFLYIRTTDLSIEKAIIRDEQDRSKLRISFDNYNHASNYFVPYTRVLSVKNAQMEIKYKEFVVNESNNEKLFEIRKPRNIKVIRVGFLSSP
ncbi:MAG: hypothetical protein DRG59_02480 [Deltaproteobacteria bacterium]|nr:MAG: hypothetical protein DRG59_02480 [Deltaproteobacteria bacterium]